MESLAGLVTVTEEGGAQQRVSYGAITPWLPHNISGSFYMCVRKWGYKGSSIGSFGHILMCSSVKLGNWQFCICSDNQIHSCDIIKQNTWRSSVELTFIFVEWWSDVWQGNSSRQPMCSSPAVWFWIPPMQPVFLIRHTGIRSKIWELRGGMLLVQHVTHNVGGGRLTGGAALWGADNSAQQGCADYSKHVKHSLCVCLKERNEYFIVNIISGSILQKDLDVI